MTRFSARWGIALLFALSPLVSCAKDGAPDRNPATKTAASRKDSAAGTVDLGSTAYHPSALGEIGSIVGTVRLKGNVPADSTPSLGDQSACDVPSSAPVNVDANDLSNSVVWIADAKTGKALPTEKRVEITIERCVLDPRIQTTTVGTGINVFNDDRVLHKLVFVRSGTYDTLAVMPFFNDGSMVANDQFAKKPGVIEIRCAQHAFMHGFIMVFDHPYFAVTPNDGSFKIDSLPPGSYKLMVWHQGADKPIERRIKVSAGAPAKVELAVELGARH